MNRDFTDDGNEKKAGDELLFEGISIDTVGENIIATIKMRNNYCYPLKMVIFPIIAPHLVIALPGVSEK